jgi:hypothetical protein
MAAPQFRAVNTSLDNLKSTIGGLYHALDNLKSFTASPGTSARSTEHRARASRVVDLKTRGLSQPLQREGDCLLGLNTGGTELCSPTSMQPPRPWDDTSAAMTASGCGNGVRASRHLSQLELLKLSGARLGQRVQEDDVTRNFEVRQVLPTERHANQALSVNPNESTNHLSAMTCCMLTASPGSRKARTRCSSS